MGLPAWLYAQVTSADIEEDDDEPAPPPPQPLPVPAAQGPVLPAAAPVTPAASAIAVDAEAAAAAQALSAILSQVRKVNRGKAHLYLVWKSYHPFCINHCRPCQQWPVVQSNAEVPVCSMYELQLLQERYHKAAGKFSAQTYAASPVQHMQGAGAVGNAAAAVPAAQPAAAPQQQAAAHLQPPAQAPPQPGAAAAAGAGLQFGNAPPGIDPAMWASLDAATASAIQATLWKPNANCSLHPAGFSFIDFMFYCVFVFFFWDLL